MKTHERNTRRLTAYYDELCLPENLGGCDILIAHISQPHVEEYYNPEFEKKYHLGYRGTCKLIDGCKAKLNVIGEFWAGLADLRIDLVHGLRKLLGQSNIIPSSLSLAIDPTNLNIRCTTCDQFVEHEQIRIAPAQTPFGPLSYVCKDCSLFA